MNSNKFENKVLVAVTAIVALLFCVLYSIAPTYADDLWYTQGALDCEGNPWKTFLIAVDQVIAHLRFDTGRLANIISPPWLALLPRWAFALTNSVVIFFSLMCGYKLVGGSTLRLRQYLFLAIYVLVLPWFDYMLVTIFALNYVWSSLMGLLVVCIYFRIAGGRKLTGTGYGLFIVACFVTGWMHEGLSVPLAAALGAYSLFYVKEKQRFRPLIFPYLALIAGIIVLVSFPAIWNRTSGSTSVLFSKPWKEMLLSVVAFNCMFYLYCIIFIAAAVRGKLKTMARMSMAVFYLVFGIVSTVIFFLFYGGQRVGWFNQLFCGIGSLWLLGLFTYRNRLPRIAFLAKALIVAFILIHLIAAIRVQQDLSREFREITDLVKASPDGTVYHDITKPRADLSLFKTSIRGFNERVPLNQLGSFYYPNNDPRVLRILPEDFRDFRPRCDVSDGTLYIYKGKYLISQGMPDREKDRVDLLIGNSWESSRFRTVTLSMNAGDTVCWIIPHIQTLSPDIKILEAHW